MQKRRVGPCGGAQVIHLRGQPLPELPHQPAAAARPARQRFGDDEESDLVEDRRLPVAKRSVPATPGAGGPAAPAARPLAHQLPVASPGMRAAAFADGGVAAAAQRQQPLQRAVHIQTSGPPRICISAPPAAAFDCAQLQTIMAAVAASRGSPAATQVAANQSGGAGGVHAGMQQNGDLGGSSGSMHSYQQHRPS